MSRTSSPDFFLNPKILNELPFVLEDAPNKLRGHAPKARSEAFIRAMIRDGRTSPVTGEIVKLECCYLDTCVLATSVEAYGRFMRRLNGENP